MRCAISYDDEKHLMEQDVNAFSEMQSLQEAPAYREADITEEGDKEFFRGYKMAVDDLHKNIANLIEDEELTEEQGKELKRYMDGDLCMLLFSILDNYSDNQTVREER